MRENGYNAAGLVLLAQNLIRSSDWYKGRQDCLFTPARVYWAAPQVLCLGQFLGGIG